MTSEQEIKLVKSIEAGDLQAENELFDFFIEQIVWKVKMMIGTLNEDYKDVACDSLVATLIGLRKGKFNAKKGRLGSYVYGITMNKIRDYFKEKTKRQELEIKINDVPESVLKTRNGSSLEKQELHESVTKYINSLPTKYREVVQLYLNNELNIREISQQLNIPPEEVSKRLWYGKKLIRKEIKNLDIH